MNDQERAAFEAWGRAEGLEDSNGYGMDYPLGRQLWAAWQAGRAALAAAPQVPDALATAIGELSAAMGSPAVYGKAGDLFTPTVRLAVHRLRETAAAPVQAVPDGWKLVPVEPTTEMLDAARKACEGRMYPQDFVHGPRAQKRDQFAAMLAAAPAAPQAPAVPQWQEPARRLVQWQHCMSYNDSYFGEPAGYLKQCVNELRHLLPPNELKAAAPSATQPAEPAPRWLTKEEIDPLIEQARDAFYPADMNPHFERCLVWLALRAAGVKEPPNAGITGGTPSGP